MVGRVGISRNCFSGDFSSLAVFGLKVEAHDPWHLWLNLFDPNVSEAGVKRLSRGPLDPSMFGFRSFGVPEKLKTNRETP